MLVSTDVVDRNYFISTMRRQHAPSPLIISAEGLEHQYVMVILWSVVILLAMKRCCRERQKRRVDFSVQ